MNSSKNIQKFEKLVYELGETFEKLDLKKIEIKILLDCDHYLTNVVGTLSTFLERKGLK